MRPITRNEGNCDSRCTVYSEVVRLQVESFRVRGGLRDRYDPDFLVESTEDNPPILFRRIGDRGYEVLASG